MRKLTVLLSIFLCQWGWSQTAIQSGEKVVYVDSTGKVLNAGTFSRGTSFSEGLAAVDAGQGKPKWFFIGSDFGIKIPYGYDTVGNFHSGICPVKKGDFWFYIGTNGLEAFPGRFEEAGNFDKGFAVVRDANGSYVINELGERASFGYYQQISLVADSSFGALPKGEKYWSLFHLNGDTLLKDSFHYVAPSSSGYVLVNRLGGFRFLDKDGKLAFGRAFLEAKPFSNGWACIREEKQWYLMDEKGKIKKDLRLKEGVMMQLPLTPAINYNGKMGALSIQGSWVY
ncbi:MAG: WG repeat-containing protein [Bacteroidota bacterium]|nr:WG repeat-containing protein [Bacteroidota bacterium]MDX5430029.1 WG repeat-containing protein [Bacteroidota bacterium]MDX5468799.1 WG repeat-containing protein [Bacteroidota bacterium]